MKNQFGYQYYLDVVRALAVTLVLLFHLNKEIFFFGFIGVDIFFVISGYVITQSLIHYKHENGNISFLNFYSKRFLRLFPALLVMLLLFFLTFLLFASWSDFQLKLTIKSLISSIFALSNFYFYGNLSQFDYFLIDNHDIPLIHSWSLSLEEQFYFIYPIILILILYFSKDNKKFIKNLSFILLVIFFISFYIFLSNLKISHFYLPFGRVWELILGCLLFIFKNKQIKKHINKKSTTLFIILFLSLIIFNFENLYLNTEKFLIIMSAIFTSNIIIFNQVIKKNIYENKIINLIGKSSYSIYLYHMPVIYFMNIFFVEFNFYFLSIVITVILSLFSYKVIEPIRYNIKLFSIFPLIIKYSVVILMVIVTFSIFKNINIHNIIHNNSVKINNIASNINLKINSKNRFMAKWELDNDKCIQNIENFKRLTYLNCIKYDLNNDELFYLIGDSYGEHLINTLANTSSIKNLYYSRFEGSSLGKISKESMKLHSIENLNKIRKNFSKNIIVIISISYPKNLDEKKISYLLAKFSNDEKIIFIAPHKIHGEDNCDYDNYENIKFCKGKIDNKFNQNVIDKIKSINFRNKIFFYDFKKKFCDEDTCSYYIKNDDKFVFIDKFSHFSKEFGIYLSDDFDRFLNKNIIN